MERAELIKGPKPEIERKFLVDYLPSNLDTFPRHNILQAYVSINSDGSEVRIRQDNDNYFLTIKSAGALQREEFEINITEAQFEEMWQVSKGKRITKTRYLIPYNGKTVELDIYHGALEGLITAEIEFLTDREAQNFPLPDYFGEEVTFKPEYKNQSLALMGWERIRHRAPVYGTVEGIKILENDIKDRLSKAKLPLIVEICGGSASGKTTAVARPLKEALGDSALILSMDDYYKGLTFMNEQAALGIPLTFDQPEVLDMPLIAEHLNALKRGISIDKPIYDFKVSERVGTEKLEPKPVIILEGLFALDNTLSSLGDIKVFVEVGLYTRATRRLIRDLERSSWPPEENLRYIMEVIENLHQKYIESTKKNADIIIKNE